MANANEIKSFIADKYGSITKDNYKSVLADGAKYNVSAADIGAAYGLSSAQTNSFIDSGGTTNPTKSQNFTVNTKTSPVNIAASTATINKTKDNFGVVSGANLTSKVPTNSSVFDSPSPHYTPVKTNTTPAITVNSTTPNTNKVSSNATVNTASVSNPTVSTGIAINPAWAQSSFGSTGSSGGGSTTSTPTGVIDAPTPPVTTTTTPPEAPLPVRDVTRYVDYFNQTGIPDRYPNQPVVPVATTSNNTPAVTTEMPTTSVIDHVITPEPIFDVADKFTRGNNLVNKGRANDRFDYYTSLLRNKPEDFKQLLEKAKYSDKELYTSLLDVVKKNELSAKESSIFADKQMKDRMDKLLALKENKPQLFSNFLKVMKAKNPQIYTSLVTRLGV